MSRDIHGNEIRIEGVDRCWCGCKYWENDHCIDCGGTDVADFDIARPFLGRRSA